MSVKRTQTIKLKLPGSPQDPARPPRARHGHDRIEYERVSPATEDLVPPKFRRFGDEEPHRPLFEALAAAYEPIRRDSTFFSEHELMMMSLGLRRSTPLIHAKRLSAHVGGAQIRIKREDLSGENPHLVLALTGQALLAQRLGKRTLVVGTIDGHRGVIAAAIGARLGLKVVVFMDSAQAERRNTNVLFSKLMGADLRLVKAGDLRNGDVREAALEFWSRNPGDAFMLTGLDAAPPPYPLMTQEFTAAIGRECRRQFVSAVRRLPDVVATRGTQSADALAVFPAFLSDADSRLVCVDAEAPGATASAMHAPQLTSSERQVARKILDNMEYPSVTREHALFRAGGRVEYVRASHQRARSAVVDLSRFEGLVPAIETAHVLAWAMEAARALAPEQAVLVIMTDNADKDAWEIGELVGPRA